MNGVFNGCEKVEKAEIDEDVALDCVHEMDTINHFVGMYPIASGGVVEKAFSPFLLSMLGVMLAGFLFVDRRLRLGIMAVGFTFVAVWMYLTSYTEGGLKYQNSQYISALVTALDQADFESEADKEETELNPIIEALRQSMLDSQKETGAAPAPALDTINAETAVTASKEDNIRTLKQNFNQDQTRKPEAERKQWTGAGIDTLIWHYHKNLGRWFNNPQEIDPMARTMEFVSHALFVVIILGMVAMMIAGWKTGGMLYWIVVLIPMLLPVFFIIEYSAWLWWYGHSLNEMGAFTLKPFMPTVFGQGKVAQFTTHSYPNIGFGLMLLSSLALLLATLLRRKSLKESAQG
ncbi:MAG: hypothetical protein C0606_06160 [Hyphomicrobiales bacterium]|nr:MAG: hypothetical protein C0606_06160 [Hyphomicrobiales bacterium]